MTNNEYPRKLTFKSPDTDGRTEDAKEHMFDPVVSDDDPGLTISRRCSLTTLTIGWTSSTTATCTGCATATSRKAQAGVASSSRTDGTKASGRKHRAA